MELGLAQIRKACSHGFLLKDWFRREAIGKLFGYYNIKQGIKQVEEEQIIIFEKPL